MYQWEWSEDIWLYILYQFILENFFDRLSEKHSRKKGIQDDTIFFPSERGYCNIGEEVNGDSFIKISL